MRDDVFDAMWHLSRLHKEVVICCDGVRSSLKGCLHNTSNMHKYSIIHFHIWGYLKSLYFPNRFVRAALFGQFINWTGFVDLLETIWRISFIL